ncbi:MAG: hypothetical protein AB7V08_07580 [Elusimicrobiales bacterium]
MKKILTAVFAVFVTGALLAPARAQEGAAGQAEAAAVPVQAPAAETPPAPEMKKKAKKKPAKKAAKKQAAPPPAAEPVPAAAAGTASGETLPAAAAPAAAVAVPVPQPETAAPAPEAKPIPAAEPAIPAAARRSSCQACFQTLPVGYGKITAELQPWLTEMEVQAADLDQRLSDIQKQIDGKDEAIEKARLITDKKESKAAVKNLGKERKALLKEYSGASGRKDDFYKQFSKEVEKRTRAHIKLLEDSLQATLSAASD